MSNGERFARLYRGYTERFGRYDLAGHKSAKGKEEGRAKTVDEPITLEAYQSHVEGKIGIGVIPLRADNLVNFAAIDIDVYQGDEQKKRKLTHQDIALALQDSPLVVTQSKSMGIHVWMFSEEGVSARIAQDYLNAWAAKLGCAGTEVFPKQTERVDNEDIGNWINLPYFGDARKAVIPVKKGSVTDFIEADLDLFLDIAEGAAKQTTEDYLIDNTPDEPSQRTGSGEAAKQWFDGPPCLQALIAGHREKQSEIKKKFERGEITEDQFNKQMAYTAPQLQEGARDDTFFNVAIYLRRRLNPQDPDVALNEKDRDELLEALRKAHNTWGSRLYGDDWNEDDFQKKYGIDADLPRITKQAAKGKWGYACTKEPLKSFCNRRLCTKRKFGIGTATNDASVKIEAFTIVTAEERQYYMTVGDVRVHIPDAQTLNSQNMFATHILNQTDTMWPTMQDKQYKELMAALLKEADRIDPPPDSDSTAILRNCLYDFVHDNKIPKGQNDLAFFTGRVIVSDDELTARFKLDQFESFLRARNYTQFTTKMIAKKLIDDLGVVGCGNTEIGGRQVRPYEVNLANLENMMVNNGEA